MDKSIVLVLGLVFQMVGSQLNSQWSNPSNSRLTELCQKSVPMNRISRSFLCHLLPAMNIQLEWNQNHNNNNKDLAKLNSNIMESMNDNEAKVFPYNSNNYYKFEDYIIPETYPLIKDNVFPQKYSNEMESNDFEDMTQFDSSEQIEDHIFNSFNTKGFIESPIIIDKYIKTNPKLNESINRPLIDPSFAHYFEDFSSYYKKDRTLNSDSGKPTNLETYDVNPWKPVESFKQTKLKKITKTNGVSLQSTVSPPVKSSLVSNWSSKVSSTSTTSTTSAPKIVIPSSTRKKYFVRNEGTALPRRIIDNLRNSTKKLPQIRKDESKMRDWSLKVYNNSSEWFPSFNKESILQNKPQNEIIVKKLHSNYTKSSVIYSLDDSIEDKTFKNDLRDKNHLNFNRLKIETISKITKNDMKKELRGKPGIDYPTYSPSVLSNFTCSGPGFYADKQFGCQVYHHCEHDYHQKFICPNGTLFNIRIQSCDHWFNVKCDHNSKKDLLIEDFKIQMEKNNKTDNTLKDKQIDHKIIADIKAFVENLSKTKH